MRRVLIWTAIVCLALGLAWLRAGRRLTLLLDGIITIRKVSLPTSPVQLGGGGLRIGGTDMTFGGIDNLRADLCVASDASGRTHLSAGHDSFPLGPRTNPVDPRGRPEIDFVPDPGDEVSFTSSRSLLSWPSPFEFRIMGGPPPKWRRYVYYRLAWKKRDGAKLEMFWRYQQEYYSRGGWKEPLMMWNSETGLLWVKINEK